MASEIKPLGGLERVRLADAVPLDTPFTVYVFPTTYCNFKCSYCAHSQGKEELKEQYNFELQNMTMDTFKHVVEQLKQFPQKVKVVSVTGHGEPMIHPDLPEMIRLLKAAEVSERIEVISNGSLLTHELADRLIDAGLDILRISLQGLSAEKYKEVCEYTLDYDRYIENLGYYYKHKKPGQQLFVKIIDVALEKGEEETFYHTFQDISDRMFIEYCQKVYSGVKLTQNMEFHSTNRYGTTLPKQQVCALSFFMLGIYPDGTVIPCDTIYRPAVLGNVNQDTLMKMWNGDILKDFRIKELKEGRFANPECARCVTPDDVLRVEDALDDDRDRILERMV